MNKKIFEIPTIEKIKFVLSDNTMCIASGAQGVSSTKTVTSMSANQTGTMTR